MSCPPTLVQGLSLNLEYLPNRDHLITKHPILSSVPLAGYSFFHLHSGPGRGGASVNERVYQKRCGLRRESPTRAGIPDLALRVRWATEQLVKGPSVCLLELRQTHT